MALIAIDETQLQRALEQLSQISNDHQLALSTRQAEIAALAGEVAALRTRVEKLEQVDSQPEPELQPVSRPRALWYSLMDAQNQAEIDATLDRAQHAGFDRIFFTTYYGSCYHPSTVMSTAKPDRLTPMTAAAAERGLAIFASVHPAYYWQNWPEFNVHDRMSQAPNWFGFDLAAARQRLVDYVDELCTGWPVLAGIILDHTRWWHDTSYPRYSDVGLQAAHITWTVSALANAIREHGMRVLTTPVGDPIYALNQRGQDWLHWLSDGLVDEVWATCYESDAWISTMHERWGTQAGQINMMLSAAYLNPETTKPASDIVAQIQFVRGLDPAPAGLGLYGSQYLTADLDNTLSGGW